MTEARRNLSISHQELGESERKAAGSPESSQTAEETWECRLTAGSGALRVNQQRRKPSPPPPPPPSGTTAVFVPVA